MRAGSRVRTTSAAGSMNVRTRARAMTSSAWNGPSWVATSTARAARRGGRRPAGAASGGLQVVLAVPVHVLVERPAVVDELALLRVGPDLRGGAREIAV